MYYPELAAVGASVRFPLGPYLNHAEFAYYASLDDPRGADPLIANSQIRGFVGTEKSLGHEWTVGAQYYAEWMLDYDLYRTGIPAGFPVFNELRSTVTLRVEKLAAHQNLHLSAFGFWGITDQDYHLRPAISYKITDAVGWTVGASVVGGNKPYTTFGQFRHNSNVFTRLRYSF
ncbi:MAG: hypothetical protein HY304_02960 [candidate division Zixibacteria bacterium]|nr:hypothetical protein [candidate division Zixibacteria bacterium]